MSRTWLLFDSNFLSYRALHTMGGLRHGEVATGTVFGFLKDVAYLMDQFQTNKTVFAWDCGRGKRKEMDPKYKISRETSSEEMTEEEHEIRRDFQKQVYKLRTKFLRNLGFGNVFFEEGFEADDIIASVCRSLPETDDAIIISADQDLWQCLREGVVCYNPITKKTVTHEMFREEWGIEPPMWAHVKAYAGCGSDDIIGIKGVGETSVAKFYAGKLKPESHYYKLIDANLDIHNRNYPLVKLPFPGTPEYTLKDDGGPSLERWKSLADAMGMRTLVDLFPGQPKGIKNMRRKGFGLT